MATAAANPRRRLGVDAGHDHYKWWALTCTSLGMLMVAINSGTLIIALPDLERTLHTSLLTLVWVILVYMIASTVLVLTAGRLSDQFGRKNAYITGFLVFAAASLGAGFASNGTELIIWRVLQGTGGAFLYANSAAIVTDAFPKEQLGVAMGTNMMVAAVGLVIGPVLGGALVAISWHWVFWFNVPFALIGSAWAWVILKELSGRGGDTSFDAAGTLTFVIGLTGLVYGISKGGIEGWDSAAVYISLGLAVIFLPLFVIVEGRHKHPMLDLEIFNDRLFSASAAASFLNGLARFALMFVFVFYFQGVQGDTPVMAGLKLAPLALGMLIASPLAGMYADRRGSRILAASGMMIMAIGLALMTTLERDTSYWWPAIFQLIVGIGSGVFMSPNTAAMMGAVPTHRRGIASGARVLVQNTGAVMSIALVMAIVTSSVPRSVLFKVFSGLGNRITNAQLVPFLDNMHTALWAMSAVALIGVAVSLVRPSGKSSGPLEAEVAAVAALEPEVALALEPAGEPVGA